MESVFKTCVSKETIRALEIWLVKLLWSPLVSTRREELQGLIDIYIYKSVTTAQTTLHILMLLETGYATRSSSYLRAYYEI